MKADDTLPKVTQIIRDDPVETLDYNNIDRHYTARAKRQISQDEVKGEMEHHDYGYFDPALDEELKLKQQHEQRKPRKFCDGGGV